MKTSKPIYTTSIATVPYCITRHDTRANEPMYWLLIDGRVAEGCSDLRIVFKDLCRRNRRVLRAFGIKPTR